MDYSRNDNTQVVHQHLVILADEGDELLQFELHGDLDVLEAYQDSTCKWSDKVQERLHGVYKNDSIVPAHCPPIAKVDLEVEMRKIAVVKLKDQVRLLLRGIRDLLAKWDG